MKPNPFHGAKLKIARGLKHCFELKAEIDLYVSRDPWATFVLRDKKTGNYQIALCGREGVPNELPAIFGDAVHNLRSSLDLLANDLVSLAGVAPKNVAFPFAESEAALEVQIKEKMKGATSDVLNIVRTLKPYKGGNAVLRGLHDLDITDKHKTIMDIWAGQAISPPLRRVPTEDPKQHLFEADWSALQTIPIDMTGFHIDPNLDVIGKVAGLPINIVLAKQMPFGGQSVMRALSQMGSVVEGIVKTFESHCLSSQ